MSAPTTAPALAWYHYPRQYEQLLSEVSEHRMEVLHEDGLYRHLRFARPGTRIWSFDLVTWPGYLSITGDIGDGYSFCRVPDMLTFFDHGQADGWINASYWAEKVTRGGARSVQGYSEDAFRRHVERLTSGVAEDMPEAAAARLRKRVDDEILTCAWNEYEALAALNGFTFGPDGDRLDEEMDEAGWRDFDHHFLIALHAILWGAKRYHATRAEVAA